MVKDGEQDGPAGPRPSGPLPAEAGAAAAELAALRRRSEEVERENQALRRQVDELARERDGYRQRYDDLPIACATLDRAGNVIEANRALAALLNLEPNVLRGVNLETAIAVPQHVQRFRDHLARVFTSQIVHGCELWLRRPDGGVTRVRIESNAQGEAGATRCRSVIFEVSLPAAQVAAAAPSRERARSGSLPPHGAAPSRAPGAESSRTPRATILVVEDESLVRKAVEHYLSNAGYRVLSAIDGVGALERAEGHDGAIDLILTDLSLPSGGTGTEIAQRIRQQRPGVGVLYMTACPPHLLARRGFSLQPGEALEKPFSKEALLARVAAELERSAAQSAQGAGADAESPLADDEGR